MVNLCLHHKFILDRRCQFSSQILVICRKVLILCFHFKKTATEAHRILWSTYGEAALSEITCRESFWLFKSGDFDVEDWHGGRKESILEDSELEALILMTRARRNKNWQNHWEWFNKPFRNASKPWKWLKNKKIGFRTSWSREMLNAVSLLVNSCFKDIIGRGFYIALWTATKNVSITIIPNAENHEECPDMPPRRRPD